ncbi:MAG: DUF5320 domain-containing protein [Deltaproteobacteria bacterium]|nr:DUF5320 domain-containing protein [Deltaproteobacteria bacterium]
MPGGDRTGPMGMGPMTGWGRGWCAGAGTGWGPRGRLWGGGGFGRAFGRGWRNWYFATGMPGWARVPYGGWMGPYGGWGVQGPWSSQSELEHLRAYASSLEGELGAIRQRLAELEKENPSD